MSAGTSKDDKLLKMPSDSISDGVIFQNFLGGMPQTPGYGVGILRMHACVLAHYESIATYPSWPHINNDDRSAGCASPPFQKSRSSPGSYLSINI